MQLAHFLLFSVILSTTAARAETVVAPFRTAEDRAARASAIFGAITSERTTTIPDGIYLIVPANDREAWVLPSCDDDGDYVIAISRGYLSLVAATSSAVAHASPVLASYRQSLSRSTFGIAPRINDTQIVSLAFDAILRDAIEESLRAIEQHVFRCSRPSRTREADDSVWSEREERRAKALWPNVRAYLQKRPSLSALDPWVRDWRGLVEGSVDIPTMSWMAGPR